MAEDVGAQDVGAEDVGASKFLSFVLRHDPQSAGLQMDGSGWVSVAALLAGTPLIADEAALRRIVQDSGKKRFALSEDGRFIRAVQGHSVKVDLGLVARMPPQVLYHGTAERFVAAIRAEGLKPMQRQQVHLSGDAETAHAVGQRHGRPVVLQVAAAEMAAAGHVFWMSENRVWLTDTVPPQYLGGL